MSAARRCASEFGRNQSKNKLQTSCTTYEMELAFLKIRCQSSGLSGATAAIGFRMTTSRR